MQDVQKLRESIAQMQKDFDALSEKDRRGDAGRLVVKNLEIARAKLLQLTQSLNEHQGFVTTMPIGRDPFGLSPLK